MILQVGLVLLAATLRQSPAVEPTATSMLPPGCGLTEEQVLELAVPDYTAKRADPRTHEDDVLNTDFFDARIVDALRTGFGRGFGSFVAAAVDIRRGQCDYCQQTTLVVVDTQTHDLVWRFEAEGRSRAEGNGARALRTFKLFPDDPVLTLVFRWDDIGCKDCGAAVVKEKWLRPRLTGQSSLVFDLVWDGVASHVNAGRRGGTWSETCSIMSSLWPRRGYRLRDLVLAGWLAKFDYGDPLSGPCGEANAYFGAVVFEFAQDLVQDPTTLHLSPSGPGTWRRRDLRPTITFPFNLKANRLLFDLALPERHEPVTLKEAASPGGVLVCRRTSEVAPGQTGGIQLVRRADGQLLRTIPDPKWINDSDRRNEYQDYSVLAFGWSADGARILAVVDTDLIDLPPVLVSLTVDGRDDRWEGMLTSTSRVPSDGFILDLPEVDSKPIAAPAKP